MKKSHFLLGISFLHTFSESYLFWMHIFELERCIMEVGSQDYSGQFNYSAD
jgi:hypothetical protein